MMISRAMFKNVYIFRLPMQLAMQSLVYKHGNGDLYHFFFTKKRKKSKGGDCNFFFSHRAFALQHLNETCTWSLITVPSTASNSPQAQCCLSENQIS